MEEDIKVTDINVGELEIDIKAIKSLLKELETERDDIQLICIKTELELSIENILNRLKQLEKENVFWKEYKEKLDKLDTKDFIFKHELENYIPKSVIKELEKEIKELKESHDYIYEAYQDAGKKMFDYQEQLENCIPKSVIREKIEELEEEKLCFYSDYAIEERNNKIELLKELLGEEK